MSCQFDSRVYSLYDLESEVRMEVRRTQLPSHVLLDTPLTTDIECTSFPLLTSARFLFARYLCLKNSTAKEMMARKIPIAMRKKALWTSANSMGVDPVNMLLSHGLLKVTSWYCHSSNNPLSSISMILKSKYIYIQMIQNLRPSQSASKCRTQAIFYHFALLFISNTNTHELWKVSPTFFCTWIKTKSRNEQNQTIKK